MKFQTGIYILSTLILALLAGNTWLGLSVQEDIGAKSVELEKLLASSAEKSEQINSQLALIQEIDRKTSRLDGKINQIFKKTKGLDHELTVLDDVVASIAQRVQKIGNNTSNTLADLSLIQKSLESDKTYLHNMNESNRQITTTLESMKQIQQQINAELREINRKTHWIPQKGGHTK